MPAVLPARCCTQLTSWMKLASLLESTVSASGIVAGTCKANHYGTAMRLRPTHCRPPRHRPRVTVWRVALSRSYALERRFLRCAYALALHPRIPEDRCKGQRSVGLRTA